MEKQNKIGRILVKDKRYLEWGISFWLGIGLMSIINVWKITTNQHAVSYSWIMFWFSIVFLIIALILVIKNKKNSTKP